MSAVGAQVLDRRAVVEQRFLGSQLGSGCLASTAIRPRRLMRGGAAFRPPPPTHSNAPFAQGPAICGGYHNGGRFTLSRRRNSEGKEAAPAARPAAQAAAGGLQEVNRGAAPADRRTVVATRPCRRRWARSGKRHYRDAHEANSERQSPLVGLALSPETKLQPRRTGGRAGLHGGIRKPHQAFRWRPPEVIYRGAPAANRPSISDWSTPSSGRTGRSRHSINGTVAISLHPGARR